MDAIVSLSALLDQAPIHVNVAGAALLHDSEAIVPPTEGEPLAHYFAFAQSLHELALACLMAPRVADRFKAQGQGPEWETLLSSEIRVQIGSFALGHCLTAEQQEQATARAQVEAARLEGEKAVFSETDLLVREMDQMVDPSMKEAFERHVGIQPLSHLLARNADLIAEMAPHVAEDQDLWQRLVVASRAVQEQFMEWSEAARRDVEAALAKP